jgi:hypothetical protein
VRDLRRRTSGGPWIERARGPAIEPGLTGDGNNAAPSIGSRFKPGTREYRDEL